MNYEELVEAARPIVWGRGRRARLDDADIEDLLQDVLTKYFTTWGNGAPDNPEAWVETATRNAIIDRARAEKRRPATPVAPGDDEEDPMTLVVSLMRSSSFASVPAVRERLIDDVFGLVPDADADLLRQRFLDGRSATEVADDLGISPANVDQRVARAKRKLREALEGRPDLRDALADPHPQMYAVEQRPRVRRDSPAGTEEPTSS